MFRMGLCKRLGSASDPRAVPEERRPPAAAAADAFLALADAARAGWGTSGRGVVAAEARCCLRAGRGRVGAGHGYGEGKRRGASGLRGPFGAVREIHRASECAHRAF